MKEELLWELEQVNLRLKSAKARVTIRESNGCMQLRATLPMKPGDEDKTGKSKKQYKPHIVAGKEKIKITRKKQVVKLHFICKKIKN
jgi:hypothetical protein